jgi:phosphosulfolactate synthase (CoM biosynthesis protein A)
MNTIKAKVIKDIYARVYHPKSWRDFKVYSTGIVEQWIVSDDNVDGFWSYYDSYEPYYEEIRQAGLKALEAEEYTFNKRQNALDKMAENAKELGLEY